MKSTLRLGGEVTQVMGSQFMQKLENHCCAFTSYEFFTILLAQLVDKWSAWSVKAAICYNSRSSV